MCSKQSIEDLYLPVKSVSDSFVLHFLTSYLGHWYCADSAQLLCYNLIIKIKRKLI